MEVREGCNIGGKSSIRRGRGGCIGEYTSGSDCHGLQTDGDLLHEQVMSHNRREELFGLKPCRCPYQQWPPLGHLLATPI